MDFVRIVKKRGFDVKVFICGFSGAGKTTFGARLAKGSSYQVLDLDEEIFERMAAGHESLSDYIEEIGMSEFRRDEFDMLKLLDQNFKDNYIIILGGGALETEELHLYIHSIGGKLVYLKEDFEVCWQRVSKAKDRPLAKKGYEFMKSLYEKREPIYQKSHLQLSPKQVENIHCVEALLDELQKI